MTDNRVLPGGLASLHTLTLLSLRGNLITYLPPSLSILTRLATLHADNNLITHWEQPLDPITDGDGYDRYTYTESREESSGDTNTTRIETTSTSSRQAALAPPSCKEVQARGWGSVTGGDVARESSAGGAKGTSDSTLSADDAAFGASDGYDGCRCVCVCVCQYVSFLCLRLCVRARVRVCVGVPDNRGWLRRLQR